MTTGKLVAVNQRLENEGGLLAGIFPHPVIELVVQLDYDETTEGLTFGAKLEVSPVTEETR